MPNVTSAFGTTWKSLRTECGLSLLLTLASAAAFAQEIAAPDRRAFADGLMSRGLVQLALPEYRALAADAATPERDVVLYRLAECARQTGDRDAAKKACTVDRTGMDKRFNEKVGEVLEMPLTTDLKKLQIFVDRSSVEIFANEGEATFTTHLYPTEKEFGYTASGNISITFRKMQPSVKDTFVV